MLQFRHEGTLSRLAPQGAHQAQHGAPKSGPDSDQQPQATARVHVGLRCGVLRLPMLRSRVFTQTQGLLRAAADAARRRATDEPALYRTALRKILDRQEYYHAAKRDVGREAAPPRQPASRRSWRWT